MSAFQQRVIDEKSELDSKREKLKEFLGSYTYETLSAAEQERLTRQHCCMIDYSAVLAERIAAFTDIGKP